MLPKKRRIERKDFEQILKLSKRYNSTSFTLYVSEFLAKNTKNPSKFSFSVSKKVSKLAVDRNRLRRRGYSAIRSQLTRIKDGYYCFFVYKKGYSKEFTTLNDEVLGLLSQAGMII